MSGDIDDRPTPEQMLARVRAEQVEKRRGRLRIYFGFAAGVGKTYAMLEAARAQQAAGVDVVVGYAEPHGRPETEALLVGLEVLPPLDVTYRGTALRDFDLDAALERMPQLILVDELAHTNAPDMRHAKRWQDVEDLLQAGVDVWTTLNVQHIESLNDVVAQITGVVVRETIPDSVFFNADEVEVVDLTPDELLVRLREGKVYIPAQAERAMQHFFRKGNLAALRELALRQTADRINVDVQTARLAAAAHHTWPTAERLLVCVGPSPTSAKVIRAARRLADRLNAGWIALHVDSSAAAPPPDADRDRLLENLRLAERLGAETVELSGENVVREILDYAARRNVTKIVIGKSDAPSRRFWRRKTLGERLVQESGDVDVYFVRGVGEPGRAHRPAPAAPRRHSPWPETAAALALATAVAAGFERLGFTEANLVMVYLLGVVVVAARCGAVPSVVASVASVLLFDVLFTQPYYSITVHDTQYLVTFTVMLLVGLLASAVATRLRRQTEGSRRSARSAEALYRLSRQLTGVSAALTLVEQAEKTVAEVFDVHAVVFLPDEHGQIRPILGHAASFAASAAEFAAAQWVFDRGLPAGLGTDTLPGAQALYLPLTTPNGALGVLAVQPLNFGQLQMPETRQLLETFAAQIASAIERLRLSDQSRQAQSTIETERLRSSLLSSVSHDMRTPLSVIAGASSSLLASKGQLAAGDQQDLLKTIYAESHRLSQLVENLLNMTRIEAGAMQVHKEWHVVEDVVGSAIHLARAHIGDRRVDTRLPADLPMVPLDAVLIEQVLVNLLDNAARYSPPDAPITIHARQQPQAVVVAVSDRGPGLAAGEQTRVFDKFYRGPTAAANSRRGAGLGLAICRAIVEAHGGRIWAGNQPDGGASFQFSLPIEAPPPSVPVDDEDAAARD